MPIPVQNPNTVAEIQGLYGPFTFSEKLLQQIWHRRDFDTLGAATADGRPIEIHHPGQWNHHGGPDFKNARLRIGAAETTGDIELHLRETDWQAHHHASDPAYARVILHVVLFPPRQATTTTTNAPAADFSPSALQSSSPSPPRPIPILTLLPLLHHDLEQYAADAAIEHLAEHPLTHAHAALTALPRPELLATLAAHAEKRWRQKIHHARQRITRLGWGDACHHTALEILGYSANRAPMLAIASQYPLESWQLLNGNNFFQFVENMYLEEKLRDTWSHQRTRPSNHPRTRLHQYENIISAHPNWPAFLENILPQLIAATQKLPSTPAPTLAQWRRAAKLTALRKLLAGKVCGNALGGPRLDTLITDGFLPLLAAQPPASASEPALFALWKNWFVGDMPAQYPKLLRALEVTGARDTPMHTAAAQGLLGFLLEAETK